MVPEISEADVSFVLEKAEYRFAKTMPENPHWYTLRKTWDDAEFAAVVHYIRVHGVPEKFKGWNYTVLFLNGFKYWTMGDVIKSTILINRKPAELDFLPEQPYDTIAHQYATMFKDADSIQEERQLLAKLNILGKVLDIGCGTGLLLNHLKLKPENYLGIDPSKEMLRVFHVEHPEYKERTRCCGLEDFYMDGFDTIVSLFGAPSYISPESLYKIPQMLSKGGSAYLMFYSGQYIPKTHIETGISPVVYPVNPLWITETFGNYSLVTIKK